MLIPKEKKLKLWKLFPKKENKILETAINNGSFFLQYFFKFIILLSF